MEINNIQVCNVCLRSSNESEGAVFIKAVKNGEDIHVCTGCIPHIIHAVVMLLNLTQSFKQNLQSNAFKYD